jgi:ketosteroid isomerase-like protein
VWVWLEAFARCVRERDFATAEPLFDAHCQGFGTVVARVSTRSALRRGQWAWVWPRTAGFVFRRAGARIEVAEGGDLAVAGLRWEAWNRAEPGPRPGPRDRRGRATLVLRREPGTATGWRAVHSHFSFEPGARGGAARKAGA